MKVRSTLQVFGIIFYAVFVGSQITEGLLLVPYWQSLSAQAFYDYYQYFGPQIGKFYTILTVIASLFPITLALYTVFQRQIGNIFTLLSGAFALLVIVSFYVYFKSANELFYARAFDEKALEIELIKWSYWHWGRVVMEVLALGFLVVASNSERRFGGLY